MSQAPAYLEGIAYSPWTEKARWALDHHRVPYRYGEHLLLFGMPALRARLGRWRGPVTVPVLKAGAEVVGDSWEIARFAESQGQGAVLFPPAHLAAIERYNALSERLAEAGRVLVTERLLANPQAKREVLLGIVPKPAIGAFTWLAGVGAGYVQREFGYSAADAERARQTLHAGWQELARELRAAGGEYLVGGALTYADIAMAATLQCLQPSSTSRWAQRRPAYASCWTSSEWLGEFADLLAWRDRVYARHRRIEV